MKQWYESHPELFNKRPYNRPGRDNYLLVVSITLSHQRNQIQEDMYFRLMRLIERNPKVSQREIANQLGVSLGGINYCIKALIERGYVKVINFTENPYKLGYAYLLTPNGMVAKASLTGQFLKRKLAEYEALRVEIESLQAMIPPESVQPNTQPRPQGPQP